MAAECTIGRLAKAVGVNIQTIRYYERRHLLGPATRASSGYRLYGPEEEQRLRFIKNAQALGFTLREIAELLNLRVSQRAQCGDIQRKAEDKLQCVEAKVKALQALTRALESLIRSCRTGQPTDRCPILTRLENDAEVQVGSRARR